MTNLEDIEKQNQDQEMYETLRQAAVAWLEEHPATFPSATAAFVAGYVMGGVTAIKSYESAIDLAREASQKFVQ